VVAALGIGLLLPLGCAKARVEQTHDWAYGEHPPRPEVMLIYDFTADPDAVRVDPARTRAVEDIGADPQQVVAAEAARILAEELTARVRRMGFRARRAELPGPTPVETVLIKGHFVYVDQGNSLTRNVIGFGVGSTEQRMRIQVHQLQGTGPRFLAEAEVVSRGSEGPGLLGTGPAAGAAAGAAEATVTGDERERGRGVRADAVRAADEIARMLRERFSAWGWRPQRPPAR
jgi:hypothetical protein